MIIGDYYINNFLVLAIVLLLFGGIAFVVVPGGDGGGGGEPEPGQNQSDSYEFLVQGEGLQAGSSQTITLVNDGEPVTGVSVLLNGEEVGTTGSDGSVAVDVPDQSSVTVSASDSQVDIEKTLEIEASDSDGSDGDSSDGDSSDGDSSDGDSSDDDGSSNGDSDGDTGDSGSDDGENDTDDSGNQGTDNDTTIEPAINRLSPEGQQLDSSEFEASYELSASNASYRISLGGEQKASGELDGEKNVSEQLSMPVNGTVGLEAEIFRDQNVLASENYTINYTADTGTDEGSNDTGSDNDSTSDPAQVTAELSAPSTVMVDDQVELDASGSSGDIINYTWELGDGTTDTTESASLTNTYSTEGSYDILLTVNGENNTEDNASTTLEVNGLQEPVINLQDPVDGYKTDQASINYDFEVNNSESDAEYSILIDDSSTASGTLDEGNNTVQKTVEVPETVFNTSVQVKQNGETYKSEKRTVNASAASEPEPEYSLNSPQEGDTVETLDSQTSVEFEYKITERKWATSANLTVTRDGNQVEERAVSVAAGSYKEDVSGLDPGSYSYEIELIDGDTTDSKSKAFEIKQVEPEYNVSLVTPEDGAHVGEENPDDFQEVDFNVSYETDTDAKVNFEIIALESGSNTYTTDDGSGGEQEWTTEYNEGEIVANASTEVLEGMDYHKVFKNTFDVELRYEWRSWITVDGAEEKTTEFRSFNITEEPS